MIHRTLLYQLLLELRVRDDTFLDQELGECIAYWLRVETMSSSSDTVCLSNSASMLLRPTCNSEMIFRIVLQSRYCKREEKVVRLILKAAPKKIQTFFYMVAP